MYFGGSFNGVRPLCDTREKYLDFSSDTVKEHVSESRLFSTMLYNELDASLNYRTGKMENILKIHALNSSEG